MTQAKPLSGKILTKTFLLCSVFVLMALYFLAQRFIYGLGAVTHMNDGYPWGLWITYDVLVGTALACGGYAMALLVYVFNRGEYHPLVRPALLTSLLGYTIGGVSIFVDVGRYWQAYNLVLPWFSQLNSVMFEVALCITTYVLVLWIEFAPISLERFNQPRLLKILNRMVVVFIAVGVLLPTLHQSSLGLLVYIAGQKISPLWQTGLLPLLFLLSAITMGYSMVIFEAIISALTFRRPMEIKLLQGISAIISNLIGLYLVLRFGDLVWREELRLAFKGDLKGNMFLIENLLLIFPMVALSKPFKMTKPRWLFVSAALMLLSGAVYRFNTYLIGYDPGPEWRYFPSVPETMIVLGFIALEIMGYLYVVKKYPVLSGAKKG
ncbi:MAG: Ni/Fe-hydrogenase cytochrome b subunit [Nitrospirae bacterium CG_4_9_14_3_um_filter_53_35]|nr:MAG: Ni/Fe-hydrogenase cytochrome b subunit [Nitrospirae bacterium CG2_30_53_67]PIS36306.1 MAG: Ni/Fe-hydrogenase cytochrome b subunit [Nitrospirae bacterium CG08_land_8_20_14_0_20_52_24]PIV85432.1 MAG: Ni/Fe-hydrogenase cytochrome b subunit [Nitrospirae bacterium CG17_big_fil_post_rev_8_21_14_2_50_50_9]PIW85068.1 MAG: Ni/Fe-hydrogenase cytochrome b subunit [Nitrospirae bacterium CG_4_8_14_3_um_filter_50_41]PIX85528.1 MAG: Ni/Fe-hydrogenase cytochrome b subunit [Nitrospirae bacterium CG_4_10